MDGVDHADEVDVEGVNEGLHSEVCTEWADPGVRDNNVEPAEFGDRVG